MKSLRAVLTAIVTVAALTSTAAATTATLQVIHNASDPGAAAVDVYVNGDLFLDEFAYRDATKFTEVPAGVDLNIGIAPGGDSSADDIIRTITVNLEAGKRYVAFANGVLDPAEFAANPDGADIAFTIFARDGIRAQAHWRKFVDVIAFHGATDAPTVDIVARGAWWNPIINDLSYGEFSHYRTLFPRKYVLDVTPGGDNSTIVASYVADLSGLRGGAAVVFASGFLDPSANGDNAPAFGLFAALGDGTVIPLPQETATARLQVIHNAADPGASVVDVYVNGELLLDEFAFRAATPFVDVPAGVDLDIGVAPGGDSSADDILKTITVNLEAGKTYVAFANGVLDPDQFAENPDGRSIEFTLIARDEIREQSGLHYLVKLIGFHGSTDAPGVDIVVNGYWSRWILMNDLSYGDFSNYRLLLPKKYVLDVTPADDNKTVVASFLADLSGLRGVTAIVFASGFLDPSANGDNSPGFGLYAALPNGQVVQLPAVASKNASVGPMTAPEQVSTVQTNLGQNYPNPFNPETTIAFTLAQDARVSLKVFNARGQLVSTLVNETRGAGPHTVPFNAGGLASGVYFYRLDAGQFSQVRKMVLLK